MRGSLRVVATLQTSHSTGPVNPGPATSPGLVYDRGNGGTALCDVGVIFVYPCRNTNRATNGGEPDPRLPDSSPRTRPADPGCGPQRHANVSHPRVPGRDSLAASIAVDLAVLMMTRLVLRSLLCCFLHDDRRGPGEGSITWPGDRRGECSACRLRADQRRRDDTAGANEHRRAIYHQGGQRGRGHGSPVLHWLRRATAASHRDGGTAGHAGLHAASRRDFP